jgi:hypothetical protein
MTKFEKRLFERFRDRDSGAVFEGYSFVRCEFDGCMVSNATAPDLRTTVRNCEFIRCVVHQNCSMYSAILEDCLVDGLDTKGVVFVGGAVYKHVMLRGRVGRLVLGGIGMINDPRGDAFRAANAEYYSSVDWALDITQCDALELELHGIPGNLIRRDPNTQILVTRERALQSDWQSVDLGETAYDVAIREMLRFGRPSEVLIAPRRSKAFAQYIEVQQRLRDAGIAEPD